ncbi:hypothetical protein PInf_027558 [Phytophthora infestans]|nr:hypothetical protein PInf_027558 [Phytophthora infestans]
MHHLCKHFEELLQNGGVVATGAAVVDQVDEFMALDSELPTLPVVLKNDDEMTVSAETTLIFLNTTYSSAARLSELSPGSSTRPTMIAGRGESSTVETETREETEMEVSGLATTSTSTSGGRAIRSTVEAGADPGESVQTEVFQSQEADGSIVTKTVKTTTRTSMSASSELVRTVEVETTTKTETTSGEKTTTVETEVSGLATTSTSGGRAIWSTVEAGAAPGESVQTELFQSQEADGSIVTKT